MARSYQGCHVSQLLPMPRPERKGNALTRAARDNRTVLLETARHARKRSFSPSRRRSIRVPLLMLGKSEFVQLVEKPLSGESEHLGGNGPVTVTLVERLLYHFRFKPAYGFFECCGLCRRLLFNYPFHGSCDARGEAPDRDSSALTGKYVGAFNLVLELPDITRPRISEQEI